jgi:hypothetical protein
MGYFNEEDVYFSGEGCIECDWGEYACHCSERDVAREARDEAGRQALSTPLQGQED